MFLQVNWGSQKFKQAFGY